MVSLEIILINSNTRYLRLQESKRSGPVAYKDCGEIYTLILIPLCYTYREFFNETHTHRDFLERPIQATG